MNGDSYWDGGGGRREINECERKLEGKMTSPRDHWAWKEGNGEI